MTLTTAQRAALEVLGAAGPGERVAGGKHRSTRRPFYVNSRSAGALVRAGLARAHWPLTRSPISAYVHEQTYTITDAGRQELERE